MWNAEDGTWVSGKASVLPAGLVLQPFQFAFLNVLLADLEKTSRASWGNDGAESAKDEMTLGPEPSTSS